MNANEEKSERMKEQNWTEQKTNSREKKGKKTTHRMWRGKKLPKMLVNGRHTEKSTCSQSERIRVEKKNRQSFRKHPLVNPVRREHIYISHQFIFKPLFICGRSSYVYTSIVALNMWTCVGAFFHSSPYFSCLVSATKIFWLKFIERNTLDFILFVHLLQCYAYVSFVSLLLFKCFSV